MGFPSPNSSAKSAIPIGFPIVMPHGKNPTFTMGDGSVFLRSGLLVPPSTYPKAALCEALQVLGATSASFAAAGSIFDICTDGGGLNYLVGSNNSTDNYYTTDGGATWSTVAHGLGQICSTVCYGNGYWLAGGTTSTARKISRSATINGTYTVVDNTTSLTNTNNSGTLIYTGGTNFAFVAQGTVSNNCAFSSNSGGTWVSKSWATPINANSARLAIAADGAGKVLCSPGQTTVPQYSTDYGATWQNGTANSGAGPYYTAQYYNGHFYFYSSNGQFDISTNGSTLTNGPVVPVGADASAAVSTNNFLQVIGGKLCFLLKGQNSGIAGLMTYDGSKFAAKQIRGVFAAGTSAALCGNSAGHAVFMAGNASVACGSTQNINGTDYVGTVREQTVGYDASSGSTAGFQYIKVAG